MSRDSLPPSVVVHVHGSSYPDAGTGGGAVSPWDVSASSSAPRSAVPVSGALPADFPHEAHRAALSRGSVPRGPVRGRAVADPHEVQKAMPQLWQSFIRANFRDLRDVMVAFGVSERAARKWWNAEGGVNGAYVCFALRRWPAEARQWLEAA